MSIGLKLFIGAIILGFLGWACYDWKETHEKVGELQGVVKTQKADLEKYAEEDKKRKQSGKIDSDAGVAIDTGRNEVADNQVKLNSDLDKKVAAIKDKYHPKTATGGNAPPDPTAKATGSEESCLEALPTPEQKEIASAQIDTVWGAFCHAVPGSTFCAAKPPPPPVAMADESDEVAIQ